jgi:hypothetical protein
MKIPTEHEYKSALKELDTLLDLDTDQFNDEQIMLFKKLCGLLEYYEETHTDMRNEETEDTADIQA